MTNPPIAIDALVTPHSLTLGQAAILEKIQSPLFRTEPFAIADAIPSLYIISIPSPDAYRALPNLIDLSFTWADTLSKDDLQAHLTNAIDAIRAFYDISPKPDESQKKTPPLTDGSPPSSSTPHAHTTTQ